VLDLACGDAGFAAPILARGLRYLGVDASLAMVEAARRRLAERVEIVHADLNEFRPPEPVAVTCCFRAIYYAEDRPAFFRATAGFTTKKLVFDINPRQLEPAAVRRELRAAGYDGLAMRPFFMPQTHRLPRVARTALAWAERSGPLARMLLAYRFTYVCSAFRC
jgi:SAM-dependent methyltransferase